MAESQVPVSQGEQPAAVNPGSGDPNVKPAASGGPAPPPTAAGKDQPSSQPAPPSGQASAAPPPAGGAQGTPPAAVPAEPEGKPTQNLRLQKAGSQAKVAATAFGKYVISQGSVLNEVVRIYRGLFSEDRPTRWMTFGFILSFVGLTGVSGLITKRYWDAKKEIWIAEAREESRNFREMLQKKIDEAKRRDSILTIGKFLLELTHPSGQKRSWRAGLELAEVEVVILCNDGQTREFVEHHMAQVRDRLTGVFTAVDREDLLSREGKKRLKSNIVRSLNEWLPKGKVDDIYFSKLTLN